MIHVCPVFGFSACWLHAVLDFGSPSKSVETTNKHMHKQINKMINLKQQRNQKTKHANDIHTWMKYTKQKHTHTTSKYKQKQHKT